MKGGIKHLIECHCYLAIYRNNDKQILHKFPVYSKFDDSGKIIEKSVKCNNCETLHTVYDIGKSFINPGKDQTQIINSKDDIGLSLDPKIVNVLKQYNCDISNWEHVLDVIEEKRWGEEIVIKRDIINEKTHVKIIKIESFDKIKIKNETIDEFITFK